MSTTTNPSSLLKVLAVSLGLSLSQSLSAVAGAITFFDLPDTLTFTLSPDLIARGSTGSCAGEVCAITLLPPIPALRGGASFGSQTILEPGSQSISDTITIVPTLDANFNVLSFLVTFTSDSEVGLPVPPGNIMREDGTLQQAIDASIAWFTPTGVLGARDDIFFQSDVVERPTPEPGILTLLGLGLAGLAFGRNRRAVGRKSASAFRRM